MFILNKLLEVNSNTLKIKEAAGFNPANIALTERNGVAYGLSYQDNGNGTSKVKLLISPLYQSKTYECDTGINVANEFKGQLSLTLIENSAEMDKVGIIFPDKGTNKEGKNHIKGLTFSTYKIKHSTNAPSVEHSGKTKLQKNADNGNSANIGNSYFQPKAVKVDNGNVIVIAHNLKDQTLVSWYLKPNESGIFRALPGKKGIIERKLFKFDNPGQLALGGNTMLYAQTSKKITKENQVRKTQIFKFSVAKTVQNLKDRKGANERLLSKKECQIDNKALSLSSKHEISFLQHVKQTKGNDLVAFLAKNQSSNAQELHSASLVKNGSRSDFIVHEFKDPVGQLYVKDSGQGCFITTAISGKNIIIFNHRRFEKPSEVTIIPANTINTFSDFVNIINGRLTPSIISSSTVALITTTEKVETSAKTSTTAITDTTKIDAVETTHPSTAELTTQTSKVSTTATATSKATTVTTEAGTSTAKSTTAKPTTVTVTTVTPKATTVTSNTKTSTVDPTTVKSTTSETTVTSKATVVTTASTNIPTVISDSTTSTEKLTAVTISSIPAVSSTTQPSTEPTTQASTVSTTVKPTTSETTVTSKATTVITDTDKISTAKSSATAKPTTAATTSQATTVERVTTPTHKLITNSEKTTHTAFTIPSTRTRELTTSASITTLLPQPTSSPHPVQHAITGPEAGVIAGFVLGAMGIVIGTIGFIVYKYVQKHRRYNAAPVLELSDLESHSSSSSGELFIGNSKTSSPEIVLDSVSVESGSRSSSPSPEGSINSGSRRSSLSSNDVPGHYL
ncbi:MAG: hypothetical protein LBC34_02740 [Rickettsiales bacterium]|jgi:hypothetical protein|nr:hypothetical protein [Rickettsiales bacterium]